MIRGEAERDGAYLGKVFLSMDALRAPGAPSLTVDSLMDRLNRIRTDALGSYVLSGNPATTEPDIFVDVLYGRLMHGDYARWYRTQHRATTGWHVTAVAMTLSQVEQLVLATRQAITEGLEREYLRLNPSD
jgi:hypothetical protein